MTYVYQYSSENIDISNIKKLVVLNSFQKKWEVSVDQIIGDYESIESWYKYFVTFVQKITRKPLDC